jgi:hypothetical protein
VSLDILKLLEEEGYITDGEENIVHAEKAFFAARVMKWIYHKSQAEADFDFTAYLTMLMYYKTDMADLKFTENEDKLLYKMRTAVPDQEIQEIVDSLIESTRKPSRNSPQPAGEEEEAAGTTSEDTDGTPDS